MTERYTGLPTRAERASELFDQWVNGNRKDVAKAIKRDAALAIHVAILIRARVDGWGADIKTLCVLLDGGR